MQRWVEDEPIEIPEDELNEIHYSGKELTIYNSETDVRITFKNENGFTARELLSHVLAFENEFNRLVQRNKRASYLL